MHQPPNAAWNAASHVMPARAGATVTVGPGVTAGSPSRTSGPGYAWPDLATFVKATVAAEQARTGQATETLAEVALCLRTRHHPPRGEQTVFAVDGASALVPQLASSTPPAATIAGPTQADCLIIPVAYHIRR